MQNALEFFPQGLSAALISFFPATFPRGRSVWACWQPCCQHLALQRALTARCRCQRAPVLHQHGNGAVVCFMLKKYPMLLAKHRNECCNLLKEAFG